MIQRCERLRLTLESRQASSVLGEVFGQQLQGNLALQRSIASTVDHAHAALAKRRQHFEWSDTCARRERHKTSSPFRSVVQERSLSKELEMNMILAAFGSRFGAILS